MRVKLLFREIQEALVNQLLSLDPKCIIICRRKKAVKTQCNKVRAGMHDIFGICNEAADFYAA